MVKLRGPLLVALAVAAALRILEGFGVFNAISQIPGLGFFNISLNFGVSVFGIPEVIAIVALIVLLKHERLPQDLAGRIAMFVVAAIVVTAGSMFFAVFGTAKTLSVASTVISEEIIYRVAIPLLVGLALTKHNVGWSRALPIGVGVSAVLFMLLPGHQAQFVNFFSPLVFVAFAVLMARVVWRGGVVLPALLVHAGVDFVTLLTNVHAVPMFVRLAVVGVLLFSLAPIVDALSKTRPDNRERGLTDSTRVADSVTDEVVIDLREANSPTVA